MTIFANSTENFTATDFRIASDLLGTRNFSV